MTQLYHLPKLGDGSFFFFWTRCLPHRVSITLAIFPMIHSFYINPHRKAIKPTSFLLGFGDGESQFWTRNQAQPYIGDSFHRVTNVFSLPKKGFNS